MKRILGGLLLLFSILFLLPASKTEAQAAKYNVTFSWDESSIKGITYAGTSYTTNAISLEFETGVEVRFYIDFKPGYVLDLAWSPSLIMNDGGSICRYFEMPAYDVLVYLKGRNDAAISGNVAALCLGESVGNVVSGDSLTASVTSCNVADSALLYEWIIVETGSVVSTSKSCTVPSGYVGKKLKLVVSANPSTGKSGEISKTLNIKAGRKKINFIIQNTGVVEYKHLQYTSSFTVSDVPGNDVLFYTEKDAQCVFTPSISSVKVINNGTMQKKFVMPDSDLTLTCTFGAKLNLNIADATIINDERSFEYDGLTHGPKFDLYLNNRVLDKGIYDISGDEKKNVGTYSWTVTPKMGSIYEGSKTISFTITPNKSADAKIKGPASFIYDGTDKFPEVEVSSNLSVPLNEMTDYNIGYPIESSQIGTYSVMVMFKKNFTGSKELTYRIVTNEGNAQISGASSFTYDGKVKHPKIVATNALSEKLVEGTDYDVTYSGGSINVGTYSAKVVFKGKYKGSKTFSYKIVPATNVTSSIKKTKNTYTGSTIKPAVIVKNSSGTVLVAGKDYTVTYPKSTKTVGNYKLTVTYKGNYSGKKTLSYSIIPKNTVIKSLTAKSKAFVVKWKLQTTKTSGYQIRYSVKSSMSSAKTITIKKNSTVAYKVNNLKSKKTYYVQMRTYKNVDGKKICSDWTKAKSIKTK